MAKWVDQEDGLGNVQNRLWYKQRGRVGLIRNTFYPINLTTYINNFVSNMIRKLFYFNTNLFLMIKEVLSIKNRLCVSS